MFALGVTMIVAALGVGLLRAAREPVPGLDPVPSDRHFAVNLALAFVCTCALIAGVGMVNM